MFKIRYIVIAILLIFALIININGFLSERDFKALCDTNFIGKNIKEFNENSMKGPFGGKNVNSVKKDNDRIHVQSYVLLTMIIDNVLYCDVSYDETGKIIDVLLSKYQDIPE